MSYSSEGNIRVKVLVIGPPKSGKSIISSFISDTSESAAKEYSPTKGVRILELEQPNTPNQAERIVELWDCSGDIKFEYCWPAFCRNTIGTVLVLNPETNTGEDLLMWYRQFVLKTKVRHENVLVLLHHTSERTNDSAIAEFRLPSHMSGISVVPSNVDHDGEALKNDFNNYLTKLFDTDTQE